MISTKCHIKYKIISPEYAYICFCDMLERTVSVIVYEEITYFTKKTNKEFK